MKVLGLDLSLTSPGFATVDETANYSVFTLKPKTNGHERLAYIVYQAQMAADGADLVVVEGPAFGAKGSAYHQLAGLWWLVTQALWDESVPYAVMSPFELKKYATGTTKSDKDAMMLATARRFASFSGDNNAADALWLACAGAEYLGHPLVQLPETHRAALAKVAWPDLSGSVQ